MLVCDKCGAKILEGAKFCPNCGDAVTEADRQVDEVAVDAVANVEIRFGHSTSANYQPAVEIAQRIPSYQAEGEGKALVHSVELPITEVELLINLYDLVGSWKSSRMLIDGQSATKSALVYHGMGCYRERQKAYMREQYCFGERDYEFNIWGCKRLQMPIVAWGGWLTYGEFDDKGAWRFDKARIRHELEVQIRENELCPVLDRRRVMQTLDRLPDGINPKSDPNWKYHTSYEEVDGDYKQVAVGIKPVLKKANRLVLGDFSPTWKLEEATGAEAPHREIRIEIDTSDLRTAPEQVTQQKSTGCLGMIVAILLGATAVVALAILLS